MPPELWGIIFFLFLMRPFYGEVEKWKGEIRKKLESVAKSHNVTIQQIAIAWLISHENVITIPKAFKVKHMIENAEAAKIRLSEEELKLFYENGRDIENLKYISA